MQVVFTKEEEIIRRAELGGISGFMIDWENKDKAERQSGFDTQINNDQVDDLARVRALTNRTIICRVNNTPELRSREIALAIGNGANEILLPMVRSIQVVEETLKETEGFARVALMIETKEAITLAKELGALPVSRVYVGLNDLSIDLRKETIFDSLEDGTIDSIRPYFDVPFGFAGLTLPECGSPIPSRLLYSEMARLRCSFTFLRRSYLRDVRGKDSAEELPRMYRAFTAASLLSDAALMAHHHELNEKIRSVRSSGHALRSEPVEGHVSR